MVRQLRSSIGTRDLLMTRRAVRGRCRAHRETRMGRCGWSVQWCRCSLGEIETEAGRTSVGLSLASSPDFDIESGLPGLLSGGLGPGRVCPGRSMRHSPCISRTLLPIASTSVQPTRFWSTFDLHGRKTAFYSVVFRSEMVRKIAQRLPSPNGCSQALHLTMSSKYLTLSGPRTPLLSVTLHPSLNIPPPCLPL
jgi:hypothetical protein